MIETSGLLILRSGRWIARVEEAPDGEVLELTAPGFPSNKMRVGLPFSWRHLAAPDLEAIARKPELRLWVDESGIFWRVATVGPGTPYEYPLRKRHLVFDSQQSWAGIVEFPPPYELGDLSNDELRSYRDRIADFGGGRRGYRAPSAEREALL